MITTEEGLLRYLCGNNAFGIYYQVHMAANEYYLRRFNHRSDYGRVDAIDKTLIVRMRDYNALLDENLHPTDKAFKLYWYNAK